ncbi:hypothetical protein NECAME_14717 [Necator americanus]|uniref:Uncharacterized protein n=1 Tax=Necator americanus TaxID=51031 RepID=W2SP86_NECAM|nr:hypothetical protein NECAME_14717 [Necator americanus]ETN70517.1 hypothetical protein NECAME_14717 [Necator americanus]
MSTFLKGRLLNEFRWGEKRVYKLNRILSIGGNSLKMARPKGVTTEDAGLRTMLRLLFCIGVSALLRIEYLVAAAIVASFAPDWSQNKVRIFSVRVVSFTHATISSLGCLCSLLSDPNYFKEPYDYRTDSAQYVFLFSMGEQIDLI